VSIALEVVGSTHTNLGSVDDVAPVSNSGLYPLTIGTLST